MPKGSPTPAAPGTTFGFWRVVKEVVSGSKHRRVLCKCVCGKSRIVLLQNLSLGRSTSCGCQANPGVVAMTKKRYQGNR